MVSTVCGTAANCRAAVASRGRVTLLETVGVEVLIVGSVGCLATANAVTTRSLWRSPLFDRPQKVAQTILLWLVPGAFVFVGHLLRDPMKGPSRAVEGDPTVSRLEGYCDDNPSLSNHGPDGGGHHS